MIFSFLTNLQKSQDNYESINPGDLLVSSSKPGFAMKNNEPKDGTVVGKAFDFCDQEECTIPVLVALS